jgi:hypothetical protein
MVEAKREAGKTPMRLIALGFCIFGFPLAALVIWQTVPDMFMVLFGAMSALPFFLILPLVLWMKDRKGIAAMINGIVTLTAAACIFVLMRQLHIGTWLFWPVILLGLAFLYALGGSIYVLWDWWKQSVKPAARPS